MIMRRFFLALFAGIVLAAVPASAQSIKEAVYADFNRAGGVYYMYPFSQHTVTAPPKGYTPVYLSHYGRHGARYLMNSTQYERSVGVLDAAHKAGVLTEEGERQFLAAKAESENEIELIAFMDGKAVGSAGITAIGKKYKIKHRATFGVSVLKDYWGLGIGRALTEACIECAKAAGYKQIELEVVAENKTAISLYRSVGFVEYGRNPKAFFSRRGVWQENLLMRLELDQ